MKKVVTCALILCLFASLSVCARVISGGGTVIVEGGGSRDVMVSSGTPVVITPAPAPSPNVSVPADRERPAVDSEHQEDYISGGYEAAGDGWNSGEGFGGVSDGMYGGDFGDGGRFIDDGGRFIDDGGIYFGDGGRICARRDLRFHVFQRQDRAQAVDSVVGDDGFNHFRVLPAY